MRNREGWVRALVGCGDTPRLFLPIVESFFFCMFVGWGEFRALADIVVGTRKHQKKSLLVFVVLLALINHPKQINDMLLSNT